jgi:hypothetical protein
VKIRYVTQPKAPPFFVLFGYSVAGVPESYKRISSMAYAKPSASSASRSASRCARAATTRMRGKSGAIREVAPERFCAM